MGQSTTGYYHFPSQVMWLRGEGEFNDTLVMAVSTSFDTVKPCTANCSRLMRSTDGGRSWALGLTNPTHAALPRLSAGEGTSAPCSGRHCIVTGPAFVAGPRRVQNATATASLPLPTHESSAVCVCPPPTFPPFGLCAKTLSRGEFKFFTLMKIISTRRPISIVHGTNPACRAPALAGA